MKNPWMSAWLSAANSMTGAARRQIMSEMSKAHRQMMQDGQKAWTEAWLQAWGLGKTPRGKG